MAKYPYKV
jgi:uncharacterized protein